MCIFGIKLEEIAKFWWLVQGLYNYRLVNARIVTDIPNLAEKLMLDKMRGQVIINCKLILSHKFKEYKYVFIECVYLNLKEC